MNQDSSLIKSVTVYSGSSANIPDTFLQQAFELGKLIANEGWLQVNGGGNTGMMGASTKGALSVGGTVDSVILTRFLGANEHGLFREQSVFDTLPERKKGLFDRADAIIALPGGLGTMDELFEVACMRQLGIHEKAIVAVNTEGYFNGLKDYFDKAIKLKFVSEGMRPNGIFFADNPEQAVNYLKTFKPITIDKAAVNSGEMNSTV